MTTSCSPSVLVRRISCVMRSSARRVLLTRVVLSNRVWLRRSCNDRLTSVSLSSILCSSDDALEYQVLERRSFQSFLGLENSAKVPDAKTIWLWRERLKQHNLMEIISAARSVANWSEQALLRVADRSSMPVLLKRQSKAISMESSTSSRF